MNKNFEPINNSKLKIYDNENARELLVKNKDRFSYDEYKSELFNKGLILNKYPNIQFNCFEVDYGEFIPPGIYIINERLAYILMNNGYDFSKHIINSMKNSKSKEEF